MSEEVQPHSQSTKTCDGQIRVWHWAVWVGSGLPIYLKIPVGLVIPWSQSSIGRLEMALPLKIEERTPQKCSGMGWKLTPFNGGDRAAIKRLPWAQVPQQGPNLLSSKSFYIFKSLFHTIAPERPFSPLSFPISILEIFCLARQIKSFFIMLMCKTFPTKMLLNCTRAKVPTPFFYISGKIQGEAGRSYSEKAEAECSASLWCFRVREDKENLGKRIQAGEGHSKAQGKNVKAGDTPERIIFMRSGPWREHLWGGSGS